MIYQCSIHSRFIQVFILGFPMRKSLCKMCELGPGSIRVPGRAVTLVVEPGLLEIHREKVQPRMCFVLFSMNHPKVGITDSLDVFFFDGTSIYK